MSFFQDRVETESYCVDQIGLSCDLVLLSQPASADIAGVHF